MDTTNFTKEERACRQALGLSEAELRAEYNRLREIAHDFWRKAQAVKAELDLVEETRLELEKSQAKVTRVSGKSLLNPEQQVAFEQLMAWAKETVNKRA